MSWFTKFIGLFGRKHARTQSAAMVARHNYMHAMLRLIREYELTPDRKARAIAYASDTWARHVLGRKLTGTPEQEVRTFCERQRYFQDNDQPGPNIAPQVTPIETARLLRRARGRHFGATPGAAA